MLQSKACVLQITIETNKAPVNLVELFGEVNCEAQGGQPACIGLSFYSGETVTVLAAKNSHPLAILAIGDADLQTTKALELADYQLSTATKLLLLLVRLWCPSLTDKGAAVLESCLSPVVNHGDDVGWEETVDASVTLLLRTCLAKSAKEQSVGASNLKLPSDTTKLKKHIALLLDRLSKGGNLSLSQD
eukprot:sb/3471194/